MALQLIARRCISTSAARWSSTLAATQAPIARVPPPRGQVDTPRAFLAAIGRKADSKFNVPESTTWDAFFDMRRDDLKAAGVGVQDRRYILWAMQQFRAGKDIREFKHEAKPPKKVRGWGPAVQHGKLLRSRRHRLPKKVQLQMTMHRLPPPPQKKDGAKKKLKR